MDPNSLSTHIELSAVDATTLHYVYSTIAQTLAGAFGILGAFMLFHIHIVNQSVKGICTRISQAGQNNERDHLQGAAHYIRLYLAQENWDDFLKSIDNVSLNKIGWCYIHMDEPHFESLKKLLRKQLNIKKIIINKFTFLTLPLTVITIALSLILLAFVPSLVNNIFYSKGALLLSLFLSILCIGSYTDIVRNAFKGYKLQTEPKEKNNDQQKQEKHP